MVIPKTLTKEKNKDNTRPNRIKKRYKQFLERTNGTEYIAFEVQHKKKVEESIQKILNDSRLSKRNKVILKDYYLHLAGVLYSIDGRRSYLTYVKILAIKTKKDFDKITKKDLQKFLLSLENDGLKSRSIFNSKLYIRSFFKWLYKVPEGAKPEEMPDVIGWLKFKKDKLIRTPDEVLSVEDVKKMSKVAYNPRDSAIHLTLFETGARCQEFLRLKRSSVIFDKYGAIIKVPTGKEGRYKKFRPLRMICSVPSLKKWMEISPQQNPEDPLWITLGSYQGRALGKDGLKRIIKRDARLVKVPLKKAFPHSYRHCRCYDLISKGFTDKDLRIWFGWSEFSHMPSMYSSAYGTKDVEYKLLKQAGILTEEETNGKEDLLKPKICVKCGLENTATNSLCEQCYFPLDLVVVMKQEKEDNNAVSEIKKVFAYALQNPKLPFDEIMNKFRKKF